MGAQGGREAVVQRAVRDVGGTDGRDIQSTWLLGGCGSRLHRAAREQDGNGGTSSDRARKASAHKLRKEYLLL